MLLLIGGEDEYEIMEDVIHHRLEGRRGIGEAEEHHQGFVQSPVSHKGHLPFVTSFDPDVIVSSSDVKLCEEHGTTELIYHFGDQRQWVAILDSDRV
ncbi:hypothetical protein IEO21_11016 [Rhodonia placenta]|uniref:Uncharacterized protein n=1 Tax=Rhodonia placenta TaxID=104341 RepID=A0A8H7TWZ5_9APHY|nr:hypothetical protein IEO21_11016 [Postia placenta]